jgi:hypothetical protein
MAKRSKFARYNRRNPTRTDYIVGGLAVAITAGLGYWLYSQSQQNALASGGSSGGSSGSGGSGGTSVQGSFTNTGGSIGGAATGSGTQVFDPNAPGTPGPVGPTGTPVGPIPGPIGP